MRAIWATVLLVAGLTASGAQTAPAEGLVLALAFEEAAGQLARDASGLGNDAVLNGARFTTEGRFGGAVECDGVDDWLTVAGADALDLTEAFTVSAWVRLRSLGGDQMTLAMKEGSDHLAYALWARSAGPAPMGRVSGGHFARAAEPLPVGEWAYLAFTFDGERLRLYVDGVVVGERFRSTPLVHSAGPLRICGNSFWGHFLDGFVDELRVYGRALSPGELANDAATPIQSGSRIGDRAWQDRNRNGLQDAGEPGFQGISFRLLTSDGVLVASTVSDANGTYHFDNVAPGSYVVETDIQVPSPVGGTLPWSLTSPDVGSDDSKDSDFRVRTGPRTSSTTVFAFPANGVIDHIDAGFGNFND